MITAIRMLTYLAAAVTVFCAIFMGKILERNGANLFTLIVLGTISTASLIMWVRYTWREVPNGKPRPEDELKRGVVYCVNTNILLSFDTRIIIAGLGNVAPEDGTHWKFKDWGAEITAQLKPGDMFVYLDDPEDYSKYHRSAGVIMILSETGRAKLAASTQKGHHRVVEVS